MKNWVEYLSNEIRSCPCQFNPYQDGSGPYLPQESRVDLHRSVHEILKIVCEILKIACEILKTVCEILKIVCKILNIVCETLKIVCD